MRVRAVRGAELTGTVVDCVSGGLFSVEVEEHGLAVPMIVRARDIRLVKTSSIRGSVREEHEAAVLGAPKSATYIAGIRSGAQRPRPV